MGDYAPTLLRYALLATVLLSGMVLLYRLLRRLGARDATSAGYSFLLPWLLGTVIFALVPMGLSLYLSFTQYNVLSAPDWVGMEHYSHILSGDEVFLKAASNTVIFAAFAVGLGIAASLAAALLMSLDLPTMGLWRAIVYLPSVIPAVSTALLWRWIFAPDGLANSLLALAGIDAPGWFDEPGLVIPAFVIMSLQGVCGNNMVIFLARIKSVDVQIHEAAALDGAGCWARFRHITIPQISPVIFYHLVTGVIGSLMLFTQPKFVGETPGRSGLFYVPYIYNTGWTEFRMGYACALSWILFVGLMLLTMLLLVTSRRWVHYESQDVLPSSSGRVMQPGRIGKGVWLGGVILFAAVMLLPVAWMVSTSLKSPPQLRAVMDSPAGAAEHFVDLPLHWRNYPEAWRALPFGRFLLNSVFIGLLAIAGEVVAAALAAYGLARFSFPGRKALFGFLLATLMIPPVVMMVPIFLIWQKLGLVGAFDPLVLGALLGGGSLHVFILHQFMKTLPAELEEAARLDGASHGRIFTRIILPQCTPVLLVICLISFQAHWNDFLGPLLYLNSQEQFTMTLGLHYFQANYLGQEPKWHWLMAITTLMALPTVLIFLVTQRSFFASRGETGRGPGPGS